MSTTVEPKTRAPVPSQDDGTELSYPIDNDGVCPNISPAERRRRLRIAIMAFVAALIILALFVVSGVNRLWRLPLILLFWVSAISYFEARDKTCVALAQRDSRKMSEQEEKIENPAELAAVKRQSRRTLRKGLVAGTLMTLIALLLPVGF